MNAKIEKCQDSNRPRWSAVVAVARNGTIGKDNALPWRLKSDLIRFKKLTMGHVLVMGRKTYESIGRPLPGRETIVLTRSRELQYPGVTVVHSLDEAVHQIPDGKRAFVVGGAEIYRLTQSVIDELYVTRVLADVDGDAKLDEWNLDEFRCCEEIYTPSSNDNQWPTLFQHFQRKELSPIKN